MCLYLRQYVQKVYEILNKTCGFDENKCKVIDEINQDKPASLALQFKEPYF